MTNPISVAQLNQLPNADAYRALQSCCVSERWLQYMVSARPFTSVAAVLQQADEHWQQMQQTDILQAFDGHPRIGDVNTLRAKFASTAKLAGHEQAGMSAADDALLLTMKQRNDEYFDKFGYIFIVCASGKSATEMLTILESRLPNDAETELAIAAAEQAKITRLRLQKMLIA